MFQRLKGAIDSRIAEEQARQRQAQLSAQGRQPQRRRAPNASTTTRSTAGGTGEAYSTERGPDPREFDPDLVTGEESGKILSEKDTSTADKNQDESIPTNDSGSATSQVQDATKAESGPTSSTRPAEAPRTSDAEQLGELPTDVRIKLRKLERLESKYGELLKAYRAAHARVQAIEPFEASLRENTPLTSISEPTALIEYLNQMKLKGDMVLEELKRVTTDRDEYKRKSEVSEKDASQMKVQIEELKQRNEQPIREASEDTKRDTKGSPASLVNEETKSTPKSRIPSLSLFSPKLSGKEATAEETSEDLFSYDSEVPKLEADLEEKTVEVEKLNKQVSVLQNDLKVARESTEGMMQTLEERTKEVNTLRDSSNALSAERTGYDTRIQELEVNVKASQKHAEELQSKLDALTKQKDEVETSEEAEKVKVTQEAEVKELKVQLEVLQTELDNVKEKLAKRDESIQKLENALSTAETEGKKHFEADESSNRKIKVLNGIMDDVRSQLQQSQSTIVDLRRELKSQQETFENKTSSKIFALINGASDPEEEEIKTREGAVQYLSKAFGLDTNQSTSAKTPVQNNVGGSQAKDPATSGNKKKGKKKKKGAADTEAESKVGGSEGPVKVSEDLSNIKDGESNGSIPSTISAAILEKEIAELKSQLDEKTAAVDRLSAKLKDQEALQEEIETLRDDLLHQGEEHVEARDALKTARQERAELQAAVDKLEKELTQTRNDISRNDKSTVAQEELTSQVEELKSKLLVAEKDLKAAEQLAAARFKDTADLKEVLTKAQPELRSLRAEVAELKSAKEDLKNKQGEITRLESKHEDLKSEMKGLSRRLGDKDNEIKTLQQKIEQESRARSKVEDELIRTQSDLRVAENKRNDAKERADQTAKDLAKAREDATSLRAKVRDLEDQLAGQQREIGNLKEDVSLKGALHASSQNLVQSLRDQTHELSTQAREALARTENLEEELAEAQRMLSERTRDGQTMRLLLNQTETGTDARIREMRERMEAAIEERDRVEDEANVNNRRMMREVEEAKNKARDAQRQFKIVENERDELETKSRSWRRTRNDLEQSVELAKLEVDDVRNAMKGLREALDESERQIREIESHKQDLRKQSDDANERIEKLTKANKSLSEEIKALQAGAARKANLRLPTGVDSGLQSSRTSTDSGGAVSPAPTARNNSRTSTPLTSGPTSGGPNVGLSQASVDYVYLKNVLLQFLERKDKAHQRQLIPVLGMLLHFNRDEEQKFISAISAR